MFRKLWIALLVGILAALTVAPAFAQGPVEDKFCGGGSVRVGPGETVKSLALFGCSGVVESGGTVQQDAVVFGGSLTIAKGAKVNGSLAVIGGSANIDGEIGDDVAVAGGSVHLGETAVVNGDVQIAGGSVNRSNGATVRGTVSQSTGPRINLPTPPSPPRTPSNPITRAFNNTFDFGHSLLTTLAMAVLGVLLVVFIPTPMQRIAETAQASAIPSVGAGCLTMVLVVVLGVALTITLIGIPIAFMLSLVGIAAWYLGWITIGHLAGERIMRALNMRQIAPAVAVIVGVVILAIITEVPVLGGLLWLLISGLGVGAVVLTRFGSRPYPLTPVMALPGPAPVAPAQAAPAADSPVAPTSTDWGTPSSNPEPGPDAPPSPDAPHIEPSSEPSSEPSRDEPR